MFYKILLHSAKITISCSSDWLRKIPYTLAAYLNCFELETEWKAPNRPSCIVGSASLFWHSWNCPIWHNNSNSILFPFLRTILVMLNCCSGLFLQLPPELEVPRSVQALSSRYLGEKKSCHCMCVHNAYF